MNLKSDRRRFLAAGVAGLAKLSLARPSSAFAAEGHPPEEDLSEIVAEKLRATKVPAAAMAVLQRGELRGAGVAGVRKRGADVLATIDDKFHLGSCTKAMTATLVGKYVERGDLDWTTTVAELFPKFEIHQGYRDVTVRRLLAHVGGVPSDIDDELRNRLFRDRELSPRKGREALVRATLAAPPRESPASFEYSNTGYTIVGSALERRQNADWEELLRREVFQPLGMTSAGFGAPATKDQVDQPWGHRPDPVPPHPFGDNPPAIGPGGTVHASVRDWAKFVRLHLNGQPEGIVSDETLATLHEPVDGAQGYALGWFSLERSWSRGRVLTHNGTNTMNFAVAWLAPKEGFGVVVACNAGGAEAEELCDALASYAVDRYAG
ncbi:MAG TPA: serine hydrolase domain-containing protein [Pirellulaceae bacterium]|jgi:CubicO group peptidase (beta-lactamase class C family)|nr:serine hydrolase domain-containing protein [Pirellulaceae bacterium]